MNATKISGNDFLDILFDGRNKDYGAYDLRRRYDKRVRNAILGTTAIALLFVGSYVVNNHLMASEMHVRIKPDVILRPMAELPPPETKVIPPPPPPPAAAAPVKSTIRVTTLAVVPDDKVPPEEEPPKNSDIGNKAIGLSNTIGDDVNGVESDLLTSGTGTGVVTVPEPVDKDKVFIFVEISPSFPGGQEALKKYLSKNTRFPHVAQKNGVSGTVFIQFVVDYEGNIKDVKTVGAHKGAGLEEEAMRVVKSMPKWKPGRQNGQNVSVQFNLPINFRLQE
ncbi:energy transducer TonB [Chitinophaga defluvii]|uniref:Energy transducer TonB n=1 Tax=Chitinophaga defluvii TaxID=3163343 RepID=A0ABV2TEY8_9BACT